MATPPDRRAGVNVRFFRPATSQNAPISDPSKQEARHIGGLVVCRSPRNSTSSWTDSARRLHIDYESLRVRGTAGPARPTKLRGHPSAAAWQGRESPVDGVRQQRCDRRQGAAPRSGCNPSATTYIARADDAPEKSLLMVNLSPPDFGNPLRNFAGQRRNGSRDALVASGRQRVGR